MVAPLVAAINEAHANGSQNQKKKQQKFPKGKPDEKFDDKAMPKTISGVQ